jgi:PAS domain S-box-containing protein
MGELAIVMDAARLPVLASNEEGYYVYANDAATRFLAYDQAQIIGKQLTDLIAYDPALIMATSERLKSRGHHSGRARYWHADGSVREADVNIFGQDLADGTRVFVSLIHPLSGISGELPKALQADSGYELNESEMRLLQLIADGFSDEQLAVLIGHTSDEVALEVQGLLTKMTDASRTEAVVRALKASVIL